MSVIGPCLSIGVFVSVIVGMEFHCGYGWIGAAQSLSPYSGLPLAISMCLNMMPAVKLQLLATTAMPNCHVSASIQEHSSFLSTGAMRLDRLWVWPRTCQGKTGLGGWALWSD